MHASARGGGGHAEAEEHRAGRHAIGHADRAINHLRDDDSFEAQRDSYA